LKFKLKEVTKNNTNIFHEMFDLTVEKNHSYCVENVAVHNCGYPQLSSIIECSHAAHGLKNSGKGLGLICADGGCRTPADVVKAFGANADFVMLGGMLAGTEECEGEWDYSPRYSTYEESKKLALNFYGMSSHKAQEKYGTLQDYRASEGRVMKVLYKGFASEVMTDILGGIRSACTLVGADCLKDLPKCAEFIRVNRVHFDRSV
jgi:GMP reductase